MTQQIEYNGKTIKMPFAIQPEDLNIERTVVTNEYSGQQTFLPSFAVAVFKTIKRQEQIANHDYLLRDQAYKNMRKGLNWFQKYFTDQYFTLLD